LVYIEKKKNNNNKGRSRRKWHLQHGEARRRKGEVQAEVQVEVQVEVAVMG
jgi:hypothetical protein